jgi:hypothetical protein
MKIFVVVLNWNGKKDTLECLDSLEKIVVKDYKLFVLVVDNGSVDGSVKLFQKIKFKNGGLEIIENKENLGFAGGNNRGIRHAIKQGADYILILNNDIVVDKNIIVEFLKTVSQKKKAGLVSPKIYFYKGFEFHKKRYSRKELGKVIWSVGGQIDWKNVYSTNRGVDEVDKGQFNLEREIDFATGACVFCSAEALREVGYFDEKYFLYLEDVDLSLRMRKAGWRILYTPQGSVWHKVSQSSGIGSELNDYFTTRNRLYFGVKYAPIKSKLALLKESVRFLIEARKWQKIGVRDYYLGRFGKGSWK